MSNNFDINNKKLDLKGKNAILKKENKELKDKIKVLRKSIPQKENYLALILQTGINLNTGCDGGGVLLYDKSKYQIDLITKGKVSNKLKRKLNEKKNVEKIFDINSFKILNKDNCSQLKDLFEENEKILFAKFIINSNLYGYLMLFQSKDNINKFNVDKNIIKVLLEEIQLIIHESRFEVKYNNQEEINKLFEQTMTSFASAIDAKDKYTAGHSERVAQLSTEIAKNLKLTQKEINIIEYGAILHDIGKIGTAERILNKKGRLTEKEYYTIKQHPIKGVEILNSVELLDKHLDIVKYHHERIDGEGYPEGLTGREIPDVAKIVSIADAWDAMTSNRSYREAMSYDKAIKELQENAGTQFDRNMINILAKNNFNVLVQN